MWHLAVIKAEIKLRNMCFTRRDQSILIPLDDVSRTNTLKHLVKGRKQVQDYSGFKGDANPSSPGFFLSISGEASLTLNNKQAPFCSLFLIYTWKKTFMLLIQPRGSWAEGLRPQTWQHTEQSFVTVEEYVTGISCQGSTRSGQEYCVSVQLQREAKGCLQLDRLEFVQDVGVNTSYRDSLMPRMVSSLVHLCLS